MGLRICVFAAALLVSLVVLPGVASAAEAGVAGPTPPAELAQPVVPEGASAKAVKLPEGVVALVDGQPITEKEWVDALKHVAGRPILEGMAYYMVVEQDAQRRNITVSDEESQAEFDKAVSDAGGPENLMADLASAGESQDMFKTRLRTKILLRKLVEKEVAISDEELKKAYMEIYGRKAEVQVIVTQTQPDAQTALNEAKKGTDFTELVLEYSNDENTARNHGYLPVLLADGFFPKPFGRVVVTEPTGKMLLDFKPGQVSDIVPAGDAGFYIFKVTGVESAKDTPFETVKEDVAARARELKTARIASEYWQKLIRAADIRFGI
jgi:foldase protein PrsA